MRSYFHRSPKGCFLYAHFYESAFHRENGDPAHLWLWDELSSLLFQRKTFALFTSDPAAFSANFPANAAQIKLRGYWRERATLWVTAPHPWGWRGKFSSWGLSQPHWPGLLLAWEGLLTGSGQQSFVSWSCVHPVQSRFLAGYKGKACKDLHAAQLPQQDTNQARTLQCLCCHAKTETQSQILWLPESIMFLR